VDDFNAGRNLLFPADQAAAMTSPCSIPPLWGLEAGEWTDWDGNTTSALGRSMLTALAGGAAFDPRTHLSSVKPENLLELEQLSQKLQPPKWPEAVLGALDKDRIARGEQLFKNHCNRCHQPLGGGEANSKSQKLSAVFPLKELGTDAERVRNFAKPIAGKPLAAALEEVSKLYLEKSCESADLDRKAFDAMERTHPNQWRQTEGYVARSLAGIWATAPYLHNGSVPTLADLLQPAVNRPARFWVGSGRFDPERVGYQSVEGSVFLFDAAQVGNSNSGHAYGVELSPSEKLDLLEFLKSL
jgi:mono/diheme cytochrome c family protein